MLLPSGKLIWNLSLVLCKSQSVNKFIYIKGIFTKVSTHFNIFPYRKVGDQIVHLKYVSQMLPSVLGKVLFVHSSGSLTADYDVSLIRTVYAADYI